MARIDRHVTRNLVVLDASAPCSEAARLMTDRNIGSVAVRRDGRIVGLVSERDLVAGVVARGASAQVQLGEVVRRSLPTVPSSATEGEVSELMRAHGARHLLVADGGEVVGVISMRDVIRLMLDEKQFLIQQLNVYIDGR